MRMLTILSLLALAGNCTSSVSQEPATETVDVKKIAEGAYASSSAPAAMVAFDEASLRKTWSSMIGEGDPPAVDFGTQSVVFVLGGSRPTGGYEVEVRSATVEGDELVLDAVVNGPPQGSIVTQAFTSPYAVVIVPSRN